MPIIWMGFPTSSAEPVHELREDPVALKAWVAGVVGRAGATLEDLYIEVGAERACALIIDLDDYVDAKAVARILGADEIKKLVNVQQAADAISREPSFLTEES
jgi:hypothetical protein